MIRKYSYGEGIDFKQADLEQRHLCLSFQVEVEPSLAAAFCRLIFREAQLQFLAGQIHRGRVQVAGIEISRNLECSVLAGQLYCVLLAAAYIDFHLKRNNYNCFATDYAQHSTGNEPAYDSAVFVRLYVIYSNDSSF